jgi:DNA-binding GntR family transcriptional regulator
MMIMGSTLRPIERVADTLADIAYQRLSEALLTGKIPPGERLVMDQLASELGISRTPVRDALLRLERENLVEPTGKRGYIVRSVAPGDVRHVYEAREAIEGFAARRVAELGKPAIDEVRQAIKAVMGTDVDPRGAFEANVAVHRSIVAATGNPTLLEHFDDLWMRARGLAMFADFLSRDTRHVPVRAAHEPLLKAFAAGPEAAFAAMRAHIREGLQVHLALPLRRPSRPARLHLAPTPNTVYERSVSGNGADRCAASPGGSSPAAAPSAATSWNWPPACGTGGRTRRGSQSTVPGASAG